MEILEFEEENVEKKRKNNLLNSLVRDFPAVVSQGKLIFIDWNSFLPSSA